MNGNTPVHDADGRGNDVPLRQYIEALIAERDKAVKEAMRQMEIRLQGLNELRADVVKDRNLLLTRERFDTEHSALEGRVAGLENWRGKAALVMGAVATIAGLVGAALMRLFTGFFGT